jgi:transposase
MKLEVSATSSSLTADVAELLSAFGLDRPSEKRPADKLHGRAKLTTDQRTYIQQSPKSQRQLAKELDADPKTIAKWKKRTSVHDAQMGPRRGIGRALTQAQEITLANYCKQRKAPLNTLLSELRELLPHLSRSTLYRRLSAIKQEDPQSTAAKTARKVLALRALTSDPHRTTEIYVTALNRG